MPAAIKEFLLTVVIATMVCSCIMGQSFRISSPTHIVFPEHKYDGWASAGASNTIYAQAMYAPHENWFGNARVMLHNKSYWGLSGGYYKTRYKSFDPFGDPNSVTFFAALDYDYLHKVVVANGYYKLQKYGLYTGVQRRRGKFIGQVAWQPILIDAIRLVYVGDNPDQSIIRTISANDPLFVNNIVFSGGVLLNDLMINLGVIRCVTNCKDYFYPRTNAGFYLNISYKFSSLLKVNRRQLHF